MADTSARAGFHRVFWQAVQAPRAHRGACVRAGLFASALAVPVLAGCQSPETSGAATGTTASTGASASPATSAARIIVTPRSGAKKVRLDARVTASVSAGTLTSLVIRDARGRKVTGAVAADGAGWRPDNGFRPNATYTVSASARDAAGIVRTKQVTFTTLTPKDVVETSVAPLSGRTVGVGMPLIVKLGTDVTADRRPAVERGLQVSGSKPLDGAWSWVSDSELHYRTKHYFPAHSTVTLKVRLAGLELRPGVWATKATDRTVTYSIGASMVSTADVLSHRMTVKRDGKTWAVIPITTGKAGFRTRGGVKVISEKYTMKVMDAATTGTSKNSPEYYRLEVPYAMRITNSGEFVHAAPWSVGSQGIANVSHGCIGMSLTNAKRLFVNTNVGDIVVVAGSDRALESGNGWTDWNVSWKDWLAKSATGEARTPAGGDNASTGNAPG